jgi:hypothetical protein
VRRLDAAFVLSAFSSSTEIPGPVAVSKNGQNKSGVEPPHSMGVRLGATFFLDGTRPVGTAF